jgi:hypothetical protein
MGRRAHKCSRGERYNFLITKNTVGFDSKLISLLKFTKINHNIGFHKKNHRGYKNMNKSLETLLLHDAEKCN